MRVNIKTNGPVKDNDIRALYLINDHSVESLYLWRGNITDAMREFAAQEVEEYKGRLKEKIQAEKNTGITCRESDAHDNGLDRAIELIDTMK